MQTGIKREMIDAFDWNGLVSEDVNLYWSKWREAFLSIIRECIPTAVLPVSPDSTVV